VLIQAAAKLACVVKGNEIIGFQAMLHFIVVRTSGEGQSDAIDGFGEVPDELRLLFVCPMVGK
jgi:hypothetical protein